VGVGVGVLVLVGVGLGVGLGVGVGLGLGVGVGEGVGVGVSDRNAYSIGPMSCPDGLTSNTSVGCAPGAPSTSSPSQYPGLVPGTQFTVARAVLDPLFANDVVFPAPHSDASTPPSVKPATFNVKSFVPAVVSCKVRGVPPAPRSLTYPASADTSPRSTR
jgi:hypothetical protein